MKLLLPLLAVTLFVTACASQNAPRRALWVSPPSSDPTAVRSSGHRGVWGADMPLGYSDPNATRRDLYSPSKASGPYTRELNDASWRNGGKTVDQELAERREQQKIQQMQAKPTGPMPQ